MIKYLKYYRQELIVFTALFLTVFLNTFLNSGDVLIPFFNVSVSLALAAYFRKGSRMLPFILISILLANVISRLLLVEESTQDLLSISFGLSIGTILIIYLMRRVTLIFNIDFKVENKSVLVYFASTIITSIIGGMFITSIIMITYSPENMINIFLHWSLSYIFGLLLLGSTILLIFHYDTDRKASFRTYIFGVIFISIFVLTSSILFSETIQILTYQNFYYVFIVFYLVLAFYFSFRMILITDLLFILLYQIFFIKIGGNSDFFDFVLHIHFFLLIISSMAISVKVVLYELSLRNDALIKSTSKLEKLVYSTESLLKLSDDILNTDIKVQEDYLVRIFKIACSIFENYDYAACYIKENPYVNFVAAVGYDTDVLMTFKYESSKIDSLDTENPIHISNEDKSVRKTLNSQYGNFAKTYPEMSEAIRFGIYIDENTIGGISFDITRESGKKFSIVEFENLKSFQKLMNSIYSINYLNYKNISLKNDIVLSLIRTLELFDQYTGGHSEEVAYLSSEIAKRCGLDEQEKHDVYWAGVVHDIGKVGIDSSIINKPSKLSLEEYEQIKEHSMFGYEILNKSEDLKTIAIIVKHHHEWWNGAGYPSGIKGDKIPFGSQILSICDAVSTMAKKRPYTIVKTSNQIIEELRMYSGVQFSPEPTKVMIEFIKEGLLDEYYKGR